MLILYIFTSNQREVSKGYSDHLVSIHHNFHTSHKFNTSRAVENCRDATLVPVSRDGCWIHGKHIILQLTSSLVIEELSLAHFITKLSIRFKLRNFTLRQSRHCIPVALRVATSTSTSCFIKPNPRMVKDDLNGAAGCFRLATKTLSNSVDIVRVSRITLDVGRRESFRQVSTPVPRSLYK